MWAVMDSNHRRRKPAELQSAPFGHSGNCPFVLNCDAKVRTNFVTCKKNRSFLLQLLQLRLLYFHIYPRHGLLPVAYYR